MQIKTDRDFVFDIAKGIGIILVVMGHCRVLFSNLIYLFHVPLFFILSGYFFNEKYSQNFSSFKEYLLKKLKTLYIPYVLTNIGIVLFNNIFIKHNLILLKTKHHIVYNFPHIERKYLNTEQIFFKIKDILLMNNDAHNWLTVATWFLKALLFISIISCIICFLKKYVKNELHFELIRALIYISLTICGYIMGYYAIKIYLIGPICSCSIFFYIGILYRKYKDKIKINHITAGLSFITLLILGAINTSTISLYGNSYNTIFFIITTSIAGFILTLWVSKQINKAGLLQKVFTYIGQHTIIILCIHMFCFKIITYFYISIYHLPKYLLSAVPILNFTGLKFIYVLSGIIIPLFFAFIIFNVKQLTVNKLINR